VRLIQEASLLVNFPIYGISNLLVNRSEFFKLLLDTVDGLLIRSLMRFIRERSSLIKLPDGATVTELRADLQDVITLPVIKNSEKRLNIQQQI